MGVQDLWSIIGPIRESVPLYSLTGKTLAVDLSLWVCEAQHVQAMVGKVTKPHLRNLFFRVSSLTLMGVKLVFVMEGEAPKLKAETMNKRTEIRFGGLKKGAQKSTKTIKRTGRGRFQAVLRECAEMLDCLGVPWVTAAGEAEAMCAYLDSQGLVDGCITNDGDAFLYGAKTVYRNFNTNTKDPLVDCYRTSQVQSELLLSRENMVGLAILLGCDYIPKGIPGVGKEHALKLIQKLNGKTLIQRFREWGEEGPCAPEGPTKKAPHCKLCLHPGSAKAHERRGCLLCHSQQFCQPQDYDYQCPCDWHITQNKQQANSLEVGIRKRTLASEHFPFTEIIEEFLISKDKHVQAFRRSMPSMLPMQNFASQKMEWPKHYTSEKVLVLMTYSHLMNRIYRKDASSQIKPLRILKPRVRNGVACFEVGWKTPDNYAFPEDDPAEGQGEVRTVEEEALFSRGYPELVDRYWADKALADENRSKKKKVKGKKEKSSETCDGLTELLALMNLQSSTPSDPAAGQQPAPPAPPKTAPTASPETVCPDTPAPATQRPKPGDDQHPRHREEQSPPPVQLTDTAASPSVSAIIDALHLSGIDWEDSFASSPRASPALIISATQHWLAPETGGGDRAESQPPTRGAALGTGSTGSGPAQGPSHVGSSLRERLLARSIAVTSQTKNCEDSGAVHPVNRSQSLEPLQPGAPTTKSQPPSKSHPVDECGQGGTNGEYRGHHVSKQRAAALPQAHSEGRAHGRNAPKPLGHSAAVTAALASASLVPRQRHLDRSAQACVDRNAPREAAKRSVCTAASSSEDSGAENKLPGIQRKEKSRPRRHMRLKPVAKETAATKSNISPAASSLVSMPRSVHGQAAIQDEHHSDGLSQTVAHNVIITSPPSSPVTVVDSDDSLSCSESPLPLAERLKLKYVI